MPFKIFFLIHKQTRVNLKFTKCDDSMQEKRMTFFFAEAWLIVLNLYLFDKCHFRAFCHDSCVPKVIDRFTYSLFILRLFIFGLTVTSTMNVFERICDPLSLWLKYRKHISYRWNKKLVYFISYQTYISHTNTHFNFAESNEKKKKEDEFHLHAHSDIE
jgi:hypothetical protein